MCCQHICLCHAILALFADCFLYIAVNSAVHVGAWVLWGPRCSTGFTATYCIYSLSTASYHKLVTTIFAKKSGNDWTCGHLHLYTCTNKNLIRSNKIASKCPKSVESRPMKDILQYINSISDRDVVDWASLEGKCEDEKYITWEEKQCNLIVKKTEDKYVLWHNSL